MKKGRHFTASVFIVYQDQVLLHKHKRFGLWLPVGGYLEGNELPHEAAMREAREEVGLEIEIIHEDLVVSGREREIPHGQYLTLINPAPGVEQVDFTFFGISQSNQITSEEGIKDFRWLSLEDLEQFEIEEKTRKYAREAIIVVGNAY